MKPKTELRSMPGELRAVEGRDETRTVGGYAAIFGADTSDRFQEIMGFTERIAPGAFAQALRQDADILALHEHRREALLGRTSNGTLRLAADARGLKFELDLPDTQLGRDTYTQIRRGDIDGVSFGFNVPAEGAVWTREGDRLIRTLREIDVEEISPTARPAYVETSVEARSTLLAEGMKAVEPPPGPTPEAPDASAREREIALAAADG